MKYNNWRRKKLLHLKGCWPTVELKQHHDDDCEGLKVTRG